MNANEIAPKVNIGRLNRIKTASRVLKVLLLLYFLCLGYLGWFFPFVQRMPDGRWWVSGAFTDTLSEAPLDAMLMVLLGIGVLVAAVVTCYQLLSLYEKGIIFSARNVQLLGRIGLLAVSFGLLRACGPALIEALHQWTDTMSSSPLNSLLLTVCWLLSSEWIIGGLFLVLVSRIMDEGRKIQEEQELTV